MRLLAIIAFVCVVLESDASGAINFEELAEQINYLAEKDMVISKNIANANTPDYLPKKIEKNLYSNGLSLNLTNDMHISFVSSGGFNLSNDDILELKPNGNAVTVEAELAKKSENSLKLKELASLFHKNKSLLQIALSAGNK